MHRCRPRFRHTRSPHPRHPRSLLSGGCGYDESGGGNDASTHLTGIVDSESCYPCFWIPASMQE